MQLAARVQAYLEQRNMPYALIPHSPTETLSEAAAATHVDPQHLVRAVLLQDETGSPLLVVLPASHLIDFRALRECCGHNFMPAGPEQRAALFRDCEPGSVPPFAEPYGIPAVVAEQLATSGQIHFEAGFHNCLVRMHSDDFHSLHRNSRLAPIARPLSVLESRDTRDFTLPGQSDRQHPFADLHPLADIRQGLEQRERVPPLPEIANRLLRLQRDPAADAGALIGLIEADPYFNGLMIRYARAPVFRYAGRVDTLPQAIERVLGFEVALNMALGLAVSRVFRNPADGPLGLQAFWRHAAYSAALAHQLTASLNRETPLRPGVAYLCGLLHNFGYLLSGQLFRGEFFLLNRVVAANPQIPVVLLEQRLLGIEHGQTGASLMSAWGMQDPIMLSCREHHNELYSGDQAEYAQLMFCVDHLLRAQGIGEGSDSEPPGPLLEALGLDLAKGRQASAELLQSADTLEAIARQLAR